MGNSVEGVGVLAGGRGFRFTDANGPKQVKERSTEVE